MLIIELGVLGTGIINIYIYLIYGSFVLYVTVDNISKSCYDWHRSGNTWLAANSSCVAAGMQLIKITSMLENLYIDRYAIGRTEVCG